MFLSRSLSRIAAMILHMSYNALDINLRGTKKLNQFGGDVVAQALGRGVHPLSAREPYGSMGGISTSML